MKDNKPGKNISIKLGAKDLIYACKERLLELEEIKAKGVIIRSKVRWLEEGERCTQYFFGLEKINYNKKQIRRITLDNGKTITTDSEILKESANSMKTFINQKYLTRRVIPWKFFVVTL